MLQSNRRLTKSAIALGFALGVVSGCKTAPKSYESYGTITEEMLYAPGYGSDRRPASSVTPVLDELLKALKGQTFPGAAKKSTGAGTEEFLAFVNKSGTEEIRALKAKKKGPLGIDDLRNLSETETVLLVQKFVNQENLKNLKSLNGVRESVDRVISEIASSESQMKGLNEADRTRIRTAQKNATTRVHNSSAKGGTVYNELLEALKDMPKNDPYWGSAEGVQKLNVLRLKAKKIWDHAEMSFLVKDTCPNLTKETVDEYNRLLDDILAEFDQYPRKNGKVACSNFGEIGAFVTAKFQERLGRVGMSAITAVKEMAVCDYVPPKVAEGADVVAKKTSGDLSGRRPACAQ